MQERTIVNEEEEEEQAKQKKILGIFPRKSKGSRTNSGMSTPARRSGDARGSLSVSFDKLRKEDDDDDLPPREEHAHESREEVEADIGDVPKTSTPDPVDEEAAVQHIPKTAGFDFAAIGKVLGKDLDVDKIQHASVPERASSPLKAPERTESAPPPAPASPSPSGRRPSPARSASALHFRGLAVEDDGDIAVTAQTNASTDMPAWDRPAWPTASNNKAPSILGFNAWSAPAPTELSRAPPPVRSAPPARPHPPELMANPFANPFASNGEGSSGAGFGAGARGESTSGSSGQKRNPWEERMALENPW